MVEEFQEEKERVGGVGNGWGGGGVGGCFGKGEEEELLFSRHV